MGEKLMAALSMCRRAGALTQGSLAAERALSRGAPLALVSADASDRTKKNARIWANGTRVLELPYTKAELEYSLGRGFAVAAITDGNMATLVLGKIDDTEAKNAN